MQSHWSLGVLVGLPILVLLVVGLGALGAYLFRKCRTEDEVDGPFLLGAAAVCWLAALITLVLMLAPTGYYPYKAEYHQWRPVSGQVAEVSKRLVSDGDHGMQEKIVVLYKGNPQEYGCDDTRCALVKTSDVLDLSCIRHWQYASTSGYDCRFVSRKDAS